MLDIACRFLPLKYLVAHSFIGLWVEKWLNVIFPL